MKPHILTATAVICLLSCVALSSCSRTRSKARTSLQDDSVERAEQETRSQVQIEKLAAFFEAGDETWLCKRDEDVRVTNRAITDENRDHFDYRIAKGKLIELPPGTRLKRRPGIKTYAFAPNRKFVRVEVVGGDYDLERGLVALDSVIRVR